MACTIGEYPGGPPLGSQAIKGSTCLARQVLSVAGASSPSQAFNGETRTIRVWTDTKMAWRFARAGQSAAIALTTDEGMSAGSTEYFVVEPGDTFAVIAIA